MHEIKLDGYRLQARVANRRAQLLTRKGLDWSARFPELAKALSVLPDCIVDGEVVALDQNNVPDFAALQAALSEKRTRDLVYFAFDVLFDRTHDLRSLPLKAASSALTKWVVEAKFSDASTVRYLDHLEHPGDAVLKSAAAWSSKASSPSR